MDQEAVKFDKLEDEDPENLGRDLFAAHYQQPEFRKWLAEVFRISEDCAKEYVERVAITELRTCERGNSRPDLTT